MAAKHVLGAINIIQAAGGSTVLGLSDANRFLLDAYVHVNKVLAPTLPPAGGDAILEEQQHAIEV